MKKLIFILFYMLLFNNIYSQNYYDVRVPIICDYAKFSTGKSFIDGIYDPSNYAIDVVTQICTTLNIDYIPIYRADNFNNACASIYNNTPIIVYDRDFLGEIHRNSQWAAIGIIAHEVGHHLNKDLDWYRQNYEGSWTKELQADYVSGFVLAQLGASLDDATVTWRRLIISDGSSSHPDSGSRIIAVQYGWNAGQ
jgi:hypothetical protein